jgi:hypothetical protein
MIGCYRRLYALSLSAFSHMLGFITVSWDQYPIRGHGRSCRAGPLSCARSFTDPPHRFDSGDCKLSPLTVHHSGNTRAFIRFTFYAFSINAAIHRNATPPPPPPAYNESHLYLSGHLDVEVPWVPRFSPMLKTCLSTPKVLCMYDVIFGPHLKYSDLPVIVRYGYKHSITHKLL